MLQCACWGCDEALLGGTAGQESKAVENRGPFTVCCMQKHCWWHPPDVFLSILQQTAFEIAGRKFCSQICSNLSLSCCIQSPGGISIDIRWSSVHCGCERINFVLRLQDFMETQKKKWHCCSPVEISHRNSGFFILIPYRSAPQHQSRGSCILECRTGQYFYLLFVGWLFYQGTN